MKVDSRLSRAAKEQDVALGPVLDASKEFRIILQKVLTSELESVILTSEAEELADQPGRQAHLNGQKVQLRQVLKLLSDLT